MRVDHSSHDIMLTRQSLIQPFFYFKVTLEKILERNNESRKITIFEN